MRFQISGELLLVGAHLLDKVQRLDVLLETLVITRKCFGNRLYFMKELLY
jgi:hypothetical protein